MLSFQQQNANPNGTQPIANSSQPQNLSNATEQHPHMQQIHSQQPSGSALQSMRLREDPPPITPASRNIRKRKSPPSNNADASQAAPPPPPSTAPQPIQHVLPPPHALMHPIAGPLPPGYQYAPADYTPGGLVTGQQQLAQPSSVQEAQASAQVATLAGRTLSQSKRAEQNRKAQRAFRERRDQHVKALESRSQLLDAALASADEANRRWEECRALVDQLRVENAALRAALSQAQMLTSANVVAPTVAPPSAPPPTSNATASIANVIGGTTDDQTVDKLSGDEVKLDDPGLNMKD
ncbi:hypothetical protein AX17_004126 [Amanita inopinata Kibby_2008]|nr:hypothetical protein AX17_004126 [Amanita inopinata Kibby_2008]